MVGFQAIILPYCQASSGLTMFKAKSFLEMLRAMWHLNFPSLCLSTGLGLPRELTGPWADA